MNDIDDAAADDGGDGADDSLWNSVWIIGTMTDRNYDMDNNVDSYFVGRLNLAAVRDSD